MKSRVLTKQPIAFGRSSIKAVFWWNSQLLLEGPLWKAVFWRNSQLLWKVLYEKPCSDETVNCFWKVLYEKPCSDGTVNCFWNVLLNSSVQGTEVDELHMKMIWVTIGYKMWII
jgi:hypothetical protein